VISNCRSSAASLCAAFDQVLADAGDRSAIRAPCMNSIMERWFRSLRAELTDRTLIWHHDQQFNGAVRRTHRTRLHPGPRDGAVARLP
jgi:transposase InsO family protein